MYRARLFGVLFVLLMSVMASACHAESGEMVRKIAETYGDAVVTVEMVVELGIAYGGEARKEEHKVAAPGTVIDPSGLTVASLSEVDPAKMYTAMMGDDGEKLTSNVTDAKLRLADGTEVEADVVLRDRDLDLAFMRPKKAPETPMKFVDLSQAGTPQLMDELATLWRLGTTANRSLAARIDRVQSVVSKPRTLYVTDTERLGCPAFTLDGKPVGILTLRMPTGDIRSNSMSQDMLTVVLPCSTVAKVAAQAKEAPPEKAAEEPTAKPAEKPAAKAPAKPAPKAPAKKK